MRQAPWGQQDDKIYHLCPKESAHCGPEVGYGYSHLPGLGGQEGFLGVRI